MKIKRKEDKSMRNELIKEGRISKKYTKKLFWVKYTVTL
jgi:hypothetical protein